jgi:recombination protein RecA
MAQGRENAKTYLREHPEVTGELERQIRANYGLTAKVNLPEEIETP